MFENKFLLSFKEMFNDAIKYCFFFALFNALV